MVKKLNRFTMLPVLLDLLERRKLVLLNPKKWQDKNDWEIIQTYKKRKGIFGLCALCFSFGDETIHHWNAYSAGSSGCCIEFNGRKLIAIIDELPHVRHGKVEYKQIHKVDAKSIDIDSIPFTKRWPYRCEEEYRVIWEGDVDEEYYEIDIPLNVISKITISQEMPGQVFKSIKQLLNRDKQGGGSRVSRSTLFENKIWINKFKSVSRRV